MKKFLTLLIILTAAVCFADEYSEAAQAAAQAGVDRNMANMLEQRTRAKGYSRQNMDKIESMLSAQYGSSATKITEKVMEGIAKNVPEDRVTAAAEKVQSRYAAAEKVAVMAQVSKKVMNRVTDMTAEAMTAGAGLKNMEKTASALAEKKQNRDEYAVAVMSLYREMVRYGVPDAQAGDVAQKAMANMTAQQINEYRNAFMHGAGSMNAANMAQQMGMNMSKGYGAGSMSGGMGGSGSGGMGGTGGMGGSGSGGTGGSGGGHGGGGHR